jgi:hypothetical protein
VALDLSSAPPGASLSRSDRVTWCLSSGRRARSPYNRETRSSWRAFVEGVIQSMMKKTIPLALALALAGAMSLSGCETPQQRRGTLVGGALGAGTGALIGSAVRRRRRGSGGRRAHWRRRRCARRQSRDAPATPLRAMGVRPEWQPRLRGLLPLNQTSRASQRRAGKRQRAVDHLRAWRTWLGTTIDVGITGRFVHVR